MRCPPGGIRDLPPFCPGLPGACQPGAAVSAAWRLVPDHVIKMISQVHGRAWLALGPARRAAGLVPRRLRRRLPSPSDDGGLLEFSGFCLTCAARSATCARNSSSCPVSASICASFAASNSRSRAFAARSPAFASPSSPSSPGAGAVPGRCRTLAEPTLREQHHTQCRPPGHQPGHGRPAGAGR
jgi:hypothetical protein